MRRISLKPDVITYNAVTSGCEKGTQPERALELIEEMRRMGLEPGVISYNDNAITSACGRARSRRGRSSSSRR